jgi:hypothetical protein
MDADDGLPINPKHGKLTPIHDTATGELIVEILTEKHGGKTRFKARSPGRRLRTGKRKRLTRDRPSP